MAKVSIVSSVYNKGAYLEKCLESLVKQTFTDIEIVLVDNGSTDDSAGIIEGYRRKDKRIKVIQLERNIGAAGGYALGIDNVTAEYFTICDADDYVPSNYIEALYIEMVKEDADVVMCTNDYVYSDGTSEINRRPEEGRLVFAGEEVRRLLPQLLDHWSDEYLGYYLYEIGAAWGKMYRTRLIRGNNINYDKDVYIWCDWLFNFKVLERAEKFVYTEQTIYHNFMSQNSVIRPKKLDKNRLNEMELASKKIEEECLDIAGADYQLQKARNRFNAQVVLGLISYYRKFYKAGLTFSDEISYLKKISCSQITQSLDVNACIGCRI